MESGDSEEKSHPNKLFVEENNEVREDLNPRVHSEHCIKEKGQKQEQKEDERESWEHKTWSSLFAKNREHSSQCSLRYVPPSLSNGVKVAKFKCADLCSKESK